MQGGSTIIASDEGVAVAPPQLAVDIFLTFLQRNVHVAVNRLKLA